MVSDTFLATILCASVVVQAAAIAGASSPITLETTVNSIPGSAGIGEIKAYNGGLYVNNDDNIRTATYCPFTPDISGDLGHFCDDHDSKLAWFTVSSQDASGTSPGRLNIESIGQFVYQNKTTGQIQYTNPHVRDVPISETEVPVIVSLSNTEALTFTNEFPVPKSDPDTYISPGQFWLCETSVNGEYAFSVTAYDDACYPTAVHYRYTFANEHHGTYRYE